MIFNKFFYAPFTNKVSCLFFLLLVNLHASAQKLTLNLETANNALVLQVSDHKDLSMVYFGHKLAAASEYAAIPDVFQQAFDPSGILNAAYTPSGSRNLMEPAISVTHADGNNSLDLRYQRHTLQTLSPDISLLSIVLKDPVYDFEVTLYYKAYRKEDVIEQWSMIHHHETGVVSLEKFASANLYLKASSYWLKQYHGDWAKEMQPEESRLTHGIKTLDTKLGTRANLFQPSVFMISLDKAATEDEGSVLYGAMEWSGNFKIDLELDTRDNLRIIAGLNNYPAPYTLQPGKDFITPAFLYTFSDKGKGDASRKLQSWARTYKILNGKGERLTLLNNWESTYFDFNEKKLSEILKDTKNLGVDLFLLDDGWFGNKYPRNNDFTALGDWHENKAKLPNGIASIVKEASANGVKFGIWIEPEMVSPKSELYEKHPDWVIKQPAREEFYFRNQLVLDLSNPEVQNFVFGIADSLFTKNPALAYIKWDCNSVIYNAYSAHIKDQSHFYIDYVEGLYKVLARLRGKYPLVPMMLCSGGGGRVDYAALQYFTEFWPSDNTEPLERIFIQWEYSYFYPAITSSNHVTDWGREPLKFRIDVAMMGKLGFDIVVKNLNPVDLAFAQQAVKTYDRIKGIIWHGDQYRLADPHEGPIASVMYLDAKKTSAIIFSYLVNNRFDQGSKIPVRLKGLDANKNYRLQEINLYPGSRSADLHTYSGDFLMRIGFNPQVNAGRTSVVMELSEVKTGS